MWQNLIKNRYRIYLFAHIMVVLLVTIFFQTIPERKIAALFAGGLFLLSPLLVLYFEFKSKVLLKRMSTYGALVFLVISAIPILYLRLANWSEEFGTLTLFGFSGVQLHQLSNKVFILMLVCFLVDAFKLQMGREK